MHPSSSHRVTRNARTRPSGASVPRHSTDRESNKENVPDTTTEISRVVTTVATTSTTSRQILKTMSRDNIPLLPVPRPPASVVPEPKRRIYEQHGKEVKIQAATSTKTRCGGVNLLKLPNSRPVRPEQPSRPLRPKQSSIQNSVNRSDRLQGQSSGQSLYERPSTDTSRSGPPATTKSTSPSVRNTTVDVPTTETLPTTGRPLNTVRIQDSLEKSTRRAVQAPQPNFIPSRLERHIAPLPSPGARRTRKTAPTPKQLTAPTSRPSGPVTAQRPHDASLSEIQVATTNAMVSKTTQIGHERTIEVEERRPLEANRGKRRREIDESEMLQQQLMYNEMEDPMLAGEYSENIFAYMRELEIVLAPAIGYLESRPRNAWSIRTYCVDIACRVCDTLNTIGETVFLAVNLLDRFLSCRPAPSPPHQAVLLTMTCVLIASKFEERNPFARTFHFLALLEHFGTPPVDAAIFRSGERFLLRLFDYQLGWPGPLSFLRRCSRADNCDQAARLVAKYILEVILVDERFVLYRPSLQAAAAIYIGRSMQGREDWPNILALYSGYAFEQIEPAVFDIVSFLSENSITQTTPFRKYQARRRSYVSVLVARWIERRSHIQIL
ncbi:G2/mitotic-specific cyclin [Linnemannia exigua]|uniref:G2/mitotic-specific cyclin n=1 Tax=Linnemannia exigua TaxID=604196 RepID=A0AAD4DJX7_9FUNG|nr:G2/mitotic-specific cyclin [Linnemannia exigua]